MEGGEGGSTPVLVLKFRPNVMTDCRGGSGKTHEMSRGVDEHLCSESGAMLDDQGWGEDVLREVSTERSTAWLTWGQEVETEGPQVALLVLYT